MYAAFVISGLAACAAPDEPELSTEQDALRTRAFDATGVGPSEVESAEYKFPAAVNPRVLASAETELWARVYRPKNLDAKHPVLLFLHGNHGTCGTGSNPRIDNSVAYTYRGTCPAGSVVTPNHLGYGYLAERMASWGYVVVSINANRGITGGDGEGNDEGLILARGKLVLEHLAKLARWDKGTEVTPASLGASLQGHLDLSHVGLLGHSRGGEGVRAAMALYQDAGSIWPAQIGSPVGFDGIFEIAPVDGQANRNLDARGAAWTVLLPMCDGDVFDLQGMNPFDRMTMGAAEARSFPKSMFAVWGTNHNFYNTEWQESDSEGCSRGQLALFSTNAIGSAKQRETALHAASAFFRANVGRYATPSSSQLLDPRYALPASLEALTPVERAYVDGTAEATTKRVEDFSQGGRGLSGVAPELADLRASYTRPEEHPNLTSVTLSWSASTQPSFKVRASANGLATAGFDTLAFRIAVKTQQLRVAAPSVQLQDQSGALSNIVSAEDYTDFGQQVHGGHEVFDSVRLPLKSFTGINTALLSAIVVRFDGSKAASVGLADIRLAKRYARQAALPPAGIFPNGESEDTPLPAPILAGNRVRAVHQQDDFVTIEVESDHGFPVADELATLQIGDARSRVSSYAGDLDTHVLRFRLQKAVYAKLRSTDNLEVRYGNGVRGRRWVIGALGPHTP